ncbi:ABC transporter ATP-binding protein, partial [Candidatus Dependentiae bacterium]|nr:ABC transporter ATP-binding protein [Candidatus Dependentiae bacterium]
GPNGAGKTTLLLCLVGLLKVNEGVLKIFDKDNNDLSVFSRISYLPELPTIPTHLNAIEFLTISAGLNNLNISRKEILSWLERVNLQNDLKKRIKKYSKGMVQRLAIVNAFIKDCDIYFLDEPILGLDPLGIKLIRDLIVEKNKEGKTIFLNSHILSEVEKTASRISVMNEGKIVLEKTVDELKGEFLYLKYKNLNEGEYKKLKKKFPNCKRDEDQLILPAVKENEIPEIIRTASKFIDIYEVKLEKESIESIFINHIGNKQ